MSPIIAKLGDKQFTPAPVGSHQAVCCDVVDLGMVESTWDGEVKRQHKVAVVWQLADTMPDGKPFLVRERYTLSLGERSRLRPMLESWRGRPFTAQELDGFDLETVIGVNCIISVVHRAGSKGGTFANVASVSPLMRGMQKIAVRDYVRVTAREPEAPDHQEPPDMPDYSDIPFGWLLPLLPALLAAHVLVS